VHPLRPIEDFVEVTLPERLGERLVALADVPPIRRFLVGRLATRAQAERVIAAAPDADRDELEAILAERSFARV
jgi:hypothetical protein